MGLVYEEDPVRTGFGFNPARCSAVGQYARHYGNSLYLKFMLANGDMRERHQASKELEIAERKMSYWERQPHFDRQAADREVAKLKRQWRKN